MSTPVRVEIPAREELEGHVAEKLRLSLEQAHGLAVQLEEKGFGYGAFWCQPPTIREALWILRCAIWKSEPRTSKTPSMAPWADRGCCDEPYGWLPVPADPGSTAYQSSD